MGGWVDTTYLGHSNKDLVVHPIRHPLFLHPLSDGEFILRLHVFLALDDGWEEAQPKFDFFRPRQHFIVQENSENPGG